MVYAQGQDFMMALLLRFGLVLLVLGLVVGLLVRRARPGHLPEVVLASALPWLLHLGYSLFLAFSAHDAVIVTLIISTLDIALAVLILRVTPRFYRRDTRRAALAPLLLLAGHFALFGGWALFGDAPFRTLPNVYFIGATLFFAGALVTYGIPVSRSLVRRR